MPQTGDKRVTSPERFIAAMTDFPNPGGLAKLMALYADEAIFEDPLQRIDGRSSIENAFARFIGLTERMEVQLLRAIHDEASASLVWRMRLVTRRGPTIVIEGSTWADFESGRVVWHRDYWDTFETLGLTFPSLASALRAIRGGPRASGG